MTAINYKNIALEWQPSAASSREFNRILVIALLLMALFSIALSLINVPEKEVRERAPVPDRIADFISQKEKPKAPPKPELKPPPPKPEEVKPVEEVPEVVQEVIRPKDVERKPLTESEIKARKVAEKSGLLALANELNDLIDTKELNGNLAKNLSETAGSDNANLIAGHDTDAISGSVAQSGGSVDTKQYGETVSKTALDTRAVGQDFAEHKTKVEAKAAAKKGNSGGGGSAEENVTMVFDKNKGSLYSLYERERRVTQGIQGKIVLQITISPAGDVTDIKIVSSELNSPELESKIVSRVKTFKFTISGDKPVTLNYPIEFLPS